MSILLRKDFFGRIQLQRWSRSSVEAGYNRIFEMLHFVRVADKISRLRRRIQLVLLRWRSDKTLLPSPLLRMCMFLLPDKYDHTSSSFDIAKLPNFTICSWLRCLRVSVGGGRATPIFICALAPTKQKDTRRLVKQFCRSQHELSTFVTCSTSTFSHTYCIPRNEKIITIQTK